MTRVRLWRPLLLCALAGAGCATDGGGAFPTPSEPDAACAPLPDECPDELSCQVTERDDGSRLCTGAACCASFCAVNACARCCAR